MPIDCDATRNRVALICGLSEIDLTGDFCTG
jgi:hypothetical protein